MCLSVRRSVAAGLLEHSIMIAPSNKYLLRIRLLALVSSRGARSSSYCEPIYPFVSNVMWTVRPFSLRSISALQFVDR